LTLETTVKPSNEFTDVLNAKLAALHPLSFIAVQEAIYVNNLKSDLPVDVVMCDFAENYSFLL
jgi:hypothetical protein